MTDDGRELLERYVRQRAVLGEGIAFRRAGARPDRSRGVVEVVREEPASPEPASVATIGPPSAAPEENAVTEKWRDGAPDIPPRGITIPAPEEHLFATNPLADTSLPDLEAMIRACEKCGLCEGRTNAVPGEGNPEARLMVVGEGPGATEDETGRPFVGRAGRLLDDILAAIGLPREQVYIANIVKCRPPNNRNPETAEIESCLPYLHRQIALIHPSVILAMGGVAATTLLNSRGSLGSLRNRVHEFRGIPLIVTYHPAALLRNPQWKKPTWDDVRIARRIVAGDC